MLQALAPYRTQANVSAAIDRALNVLSGMQKDVGSFDAWGASSSESISQVLVALCALGIDPAKDSRFVRANGAWLVSALMTSACRRKPALPSATLNRTANLHGHRAGGLCPRGLRALPHGQPALYTMTDTTYGTHTCVRYRDTARHWGAALCLRGDGAGPHEWRRQRLLRSRGNAEPCHARHDPLARFRQPRSRRRQLFRTSRPGSGTPRPFRGRSRAALCRAWAKNRFAPMDSITREQLAVMLWRASGSPGSTQSLAAFPDAGTCSDWASTALAWAVERGILNGMDGRLAPGGTATRAQAAAMLTRYLQ